MSNRAQSGFTLIELIIALAIAAILMGVAVPSFVSVVRDAKLGQVVDPTRRALMLARSEATRSRTNVTVCPRASDTSCGTNWNNGLLVFVDGTFGPTEGSATRDNDDEIVAIMEPHGTDNVLSAMASNDRTASGVFTPNYIRFGFDGRASWQNGSLIACDTVRGAEHSRALNVSLSGSVREARADGSDTVPEDVFGRSIECGA